MARILAYCDSPTAPTGFGRSAKHVLEALHGAGHQIVQLAVNHNPATTPQVPWRLYLPDQAGDPYALSVLPRILMQEAPFDLLWTTFDPECPWSYKVPGITPEASVLALLTSLRGSNPGFRMLGWFPVDGGPLSDFELAVLGSPQTFDLVATMSQHVHDLVQWTLKLKGIPADQKAITERIKIVPHGVEMSKYRVADDDARRAAKQKLGYDPDGFLIVQVERNQPRKLPYLGLALLEKLRIRTHGRPIFLYQHMQDDEETKGCGVGFRMRDLAWRYGLKPDVDVKWPVRVFTEEEMSDVVYAAADVVFSGSSGEGFQYPLWEALACGRRVIAPNDSARASWLKHAPGAHLYDTDDTGLVIRGSYNRRTGFPNILDATRIVTAMMDGKKSYAEVPEASRSWVEKRADYRFVQEWWVNAVAAEYDILERARAEVKVTVSTPGDVVIDCRANLGMGDTVMVGAAVRAYKDAHPDQRVVWALPGNGLHNQIAEWLGAADAVQFQPGVPITALAPHVFAVSALWSAWPSGPADPGWMGGLNRTTRVAQVLGLDAEKFDARFPCSPVLAERATKEVLNRYGVPADCCVVLALESGQANRSLPHAYILSLAKMVSAGGYTPILIGRHPVPCDLVGIVNLAGKTDIPAVLGLIGTCAATVAVDSFPMHVAAAMERPLVALMALYPGHTRLAHYAGPMQVLEPSVPSLAGEQWPAGEAGSPLWVQSFRPRVIARALGDLLGNIDLGRVKVVS